MLGRLFWSLKKSARLNKIASILGPKPDGGKSFKRVFANGGFNIKAIAPRLKKIEEGKNKLFALIKDDPITSKLLQDYAITDSVLDNLYGKMITNGAGIYIKGHWIPASTLAFGQTLEYVLKHRNDERKQFKNVCCRVLQYFYDNETGEIEE